MDANLVSLARTGRAPASDLRGLGDAWRAAESALLAEATSAPRRANRLADRFAALAARSGEPEARGRAARLRGSVHSHAGRFAEAVRAYRQAIRLLGGAARDGARVGLATALARLGRTQAAVRICRAARTDADARGDRLLASAARMNEAVVLHESGDPAAAVALYGAAREGFAAAGQPRHAARAADALANALVLLDRFDEALALSAEAIPALETHGLAREATIARANRGALLLSLDRLGEAESELESAERALRTLGDTANAALARLDRGDALLRAHLVPEALHLIRTATRAGGGRVPPTESARAALLRARAEIASGNAAAARRVLARRLPLESRRTHAERLELLGRAHAADGRWRDAVRTLRRAASAAEMASERARRCAAAAWCAAEAGDLPSARRLARDAERLAGRLPLPALAFAASAARFVAEDASGRGRESMAALDRAFASLEALRAGLGPDAMRAALLRGSDAWFARAVRRTLDLRGAEAALALIERWRARALADLLGDGDRATPADGAIDRLRERLALLERRLAGEGVPALLRTATAQAGHRAARDVAAAERALRREAERRPAAPGAAPPDLRAFARSLPDGVVVVSLFTDEVVGRAFVLERTGLRTVDGLARAPELAALAEEMHFRVGKLALGPEYVGRHRRRLDEETDDLLRRLSAATFGPIADVLRRARRVIFVPHAAWHRVPFGALPLDGAPLAARVPVSLAPSIAALAHTPPRAAGPSLVVAVADARAPAIADEGRRVAATLGGAALAEGDLATVAALDLPVAPAVLHVAAHGRFRDDAPAMSAVRLGDGWLRACEFGRLRLRGSLVVLSGCDTGVVRVEGAGEAAGLVRGVLAAGARDVVVSLWRVDDASTADLMARFHAERAAGRAPDAALAAAQAALRAQNLHAWAWAGFSCWTRSTDAPA